MNEKVNLTTYTSFSQIPGLDSEKQATITLDKIYNAMPENSVLQTAIWKEVYTSFSFPKKITGNYLILRIDKTEPTYGNVTIYDLMANKIYRKTRYGKVFTDFVENGFFNLGDYLESDADIKMNGHEIYWNNVGTNGFRSGTDSAALATLNNLDIKSHYGVSFSCTCPGQIYNGSVTINTRDGSIHTLGKIYSRNGYTVPVASLSGTTLTITI